MIRQTAFALAVLGLACAPGWAHDYTAPTYVLKERQVELSADDIRDCQNMMENFDQFDEELERNGVPRKSPEDDLKAIEELVKVNKIEDSQAVRLLLSLRETTNSCAMDSYTILAKIWLTNSLDFGMRSNRIASYVHSYLKQHALNCRREYARQFDELMERMKNDEPKALERVQASLAGMRFKDLTEHSKSMKSPGMVWRIISDTIGIIDHVDYIRFGRSASKSVAKQIGAMMKEDGVWDSFKPFKPACSIGAAVPAACWPSAWSSTAPAKAALREYLFEPCEKYSEHFKPVLAPARLDANLQEEGQPDPLLSYGTELTDAMAKRLMCLHLAEIQKDELKVLVASLIELKKKDSKNHSSRGQSSTYW